VVAAS